MCAGKLIRIWIGLFALGLAGLAQADEIPAGLRALFASGIEHEGARAELAGLLGPLPETRRPIRWHLPRLRGHPARISLIAEADGRRWYVPVRLRWWAQAAVAATDIPARSLLSRDMIRIARIDVSGHRGRYWTEASGPVGLKTRAPIRKGQLLTQAQLLVPPVIRRGDTVTIQFDRGALHVRAEGRALRDAARGQRLAVKNLKSGQRLQAIAVAPGRVRIPGGRG